jgi:hypothetical protein
MTTNMKTLVTTDDNLTDVIKAPCHFVKIYAVI